MFVIAAFRSCLRTESARRHSKLFSERVTKVRGVTEAPRERNLSDSFVSEARVREIISALFQASRPDMISQRDAGRRKQSVQMTNGDSHRRRDLNRPQCWFRDMGRDELENSSA
jgi:hypothetical protein